MTTGTPTPRWRRRLWIALGLLGLFTIAGFFVAPPIVKAQLEKRLSAQLGRAVTVGKVRVNPYALSVTVENLDVRLKEGDGSFLRWNRLYVNFDALASITGAWVLGAVELDGLRVAAILQPDGSFNFSDILERVAPANGPPAAAAAPARPIRVGSLIVREARMEFTDRTPAKPFSTVLGPVSFSVTEFHTGGEGKAPYRFEAVTEAGERLAWNGTLQANPFRSAGELRLENIVLVKYSPYHAERMQADVVDGRISMSGRYDANLAKDQRVLKLIDGALSLRGLKVVERGTQEPLVDLPSLDVTGVQADALARKATIASIAATGGQLRVRREADGTLNLPRLLLPPPAAGGAEPSSTPASTPAPDLTVADLALDNFAVKLTDLAGPRPAQLELGAVKLAAKQLTLADGAVMPLQLSFNWAPEGTVQLDGTVALKPELKADLKVEVASFAILPLSPYIEQFVNARLTQGTASASLAVQVTLAGERPAVTIEGRAAMDKLGVVDGARNAELAGFGSLALEGLKVATEPQLAVTLDELKLAAPYARVVVEADKTVNLKSVALPAAPGTPAAPAPDPAPAAPLPRIEIRRVTIADGNFSLADRSVQPEVRMALAGFGGTLAGLSSENPGRGELDLKGTVDGVGPIALAGRIDPFGANRLLEVKIDFRNVDLLPLSPYSGKYAGYELARGKLGLDVKFQVHGRRIDATNLITLDQFTFGAPVPGPDATTLPVRLGVALLKDTDGRIVIDVPVQGDLDDPSFRVGKVVLRVIVNLLTKAAVSPFALLGSMFGGGGEELAFQEFQPGAAELQATETPKLATLVKALSARPGLGLAIEGGYDGPADTRALQQRQFADLVRRRIWEERHATDPNTPPPAALEITPEAHAAMVKKLFDEKFPPGTELGAPPPPPPPVTAAPAAKKGLLRRVVEVVTFKGATTEVPAADAASAPEGATDAGPSLAEMTARLAATLEVSDDDLGALAAARAQSVRDHLVTVGQIAPERLFLAQGGTGPAKASQGPRVGLTLQ